MNILKKNLAPITDEAWEELKEQAQNIFNVYLTAREFVDIDGPNGLDMAGVSTGRLTIPEEPAKNQAHFGIREFLPLVEVREQFSLDVWELDNIKRGAKDIDLTPLEEAARKVARFEENAIYNGFAHARIEGLKNSASNKPGKSPAETDGFLKQVGAQILSMRNEGVQGPYSLVVNQQKWQDLVTLAKGYPVTRQLEEVTGGRVLVSQTSDDSYLISERGGDFELVLGQDLSLGYEGHDDEQVRLFITESFTFRVLSPEAIRLLSLSN